MLQQRFFELEDRLPAWLRPSYRGALLVLGPSFERGGKIFLGAILATLMLMAGPRPGLVLFFGLFAITVIAGAAGGTILGLLHPLEDLGRVGTLLRWSFTIFGFIAAFVVLTPQGPFNLQDPTFYPLAAGVSVLGAGLLLLLDDRRPGRPSPRKFRSLQNRERLWTRAAWARARKQPGRRVPLPA